MPDIRQLEGVVNPEVLQAMREASKQLQSLGIPHALAGGLAVSAWARPRWTRDVDFVVDKTAFEITPGGIVSFKPGVPLQVHDVVVDPILPKEGDGVPDPPHAIESAPVASSRSNAGNSHRLERTSTSDGDRGDSTPFRPGRQVRVLVQ